MMRDLHERYPRTVSPPTGYVTDDHVSALAEHGPSPVHRYSFVNVTRASALVNPVDPSAPQSGGPGARDAGLADPGRWPGPGESTRAGASGENERRMNS